MTSHYNVPIEYRLRLARPIERRLRRVLINISLVAIGFAIQEFFATIVLNRWTVYTYLYTLHRTLGQQVRRASASVGRGRASGQGPRDHSRG